MLIGEFARCTGLTQDTIRLYIRKNLLTPQLGTKGGSNPYHIFDERDISMANMIRFAKALGMSLKEIAQVSAEMRREGLSPQREIELLNTQLARLEEKRQQLATLTEYVLAKRDWMVKGKPGTEPRFADCIPPGRADSFSA